MKSPDNLRYITLAQIAGCALVVLGHSFPFVTAYPAGAVKFIQFLYAFHMPLFVWCSGFLFAHTEQTRRKTFGTYLRQRTLRLLTPYVVLSLVGLVPKMLAASVLNDTLELDAMQIVRAFLVPREGVWGHFWFLPMICWTGIAGYALDKLVKQNRNGWLFITLAAFALSFVKREELEWLAINDVLQLFVFYSLGVWCCRIGLRKLTTAQLGLMVAGGVAVSVGLFLAVHGSAATLHVRNTAIACLMTAAIVGLCKLAERKCSVDRAAPLAQTYQIFILSWPCQLVMGILMERILHLSWLVFVPTVFLTGIALPLVLLRAVDIFEIKTKTRILSFVLGRQTNKKL